MSERVCKEVKKKSFSRASLALLILVTGSGLSHAEVVGAQHWITPINSAPTWRSVTFQDDVVTIDTYPHLSAEEYTADPNVWNRYVCTSTSDAHCQNKSQFSFISLLPVCKDSAATDCIEGLESQSPAGVNEIASFSRYTIPNHVNKFPADDKLGIPNTETPSIWNLKSAPHPSGTEYALVVGLKGSVRVGDRGNATSKQLYTYLIPVSYTTPTDPRSESPAHVSYDSQWEVKSADGYTNSGGYGASVDACVLSLSEAGKCITPDSFPVGFKYKVKIRLASEPTAWLHGRMVDPSIQIEKVGTSTKLTVEAMPTKVPVFYLGATAQSLPTEANKFWFDCFQTSNCATAGGTKDGRQIDWHQTWTEPLSENYNLWLSATNFGNAALQGIKILAPLAGDKSVALPDAWSFHTLSDGEMNAANPCFTSGPGVKGIVTTNSTTYSEGPPTFADGSLNYKVASAHFAPDGSVFKGNYNLVMKSDVARCIYKFSSAPIKASIEVVSENGDTSNVATTAANEKDGWLYLSANNFTFSAPTVKVKLSQDAPVTQVVPVVPAPATQRKPSAKQITITCFKGKTSKKVTAAKPVCPKGYVKK